MIYLRQSDLRALVERAIGLPGETHPVVLKRCEMSQGILFHVDRKIPLRETVHRYGSAEHIDMMREAKDLAGQGHISLDEDDAAMLETDIGEYGTYEGRKVPLDLPFVAEDDGWEPWHGYTDIDWRAGSLEEAEYQGRKVDLNDPFRAGDGGSHKFYVYTKNEKGNVIKLGFGSPDMSVKAHSPERARSFLARHNCDTPGPRWKARWWSCNLHRYKKQLGLNFKGRW
jgi:hypothetical protein